MNDDELKKKLSVLKSAKVPSGYWESYWPRLKTSLVRSPRVEEAVPQSFGIGWWVPAFAALLIGSGGFWWGRQSAPRFMAIDPNIHLASATSETQAQRVFREMLQLFPNRVNWISVVDGKVDFSIRSVAYPVSKALIPLAITLPRAQDPFEARFLIRPGQAARVESAWDKKTEAAIHIQLVPDGQKALVSCRLNGSGLETEVDISKDGVQPLGSFRAGERLIQVQLTRPRR